MPRVRRSNRLNNFVSCFHILLEYHHLFYRPRLPRSQDLVPKNVLINGEEEEETRDQEKNEQSSATVRKKARKFLLPKILGNQKLLRWCPIFIFIWGINVNAHLGNCLDAVSSSQTKVNGGKRGSRHNNLFHLLLPHHRRRRFNYILHATNEAIRDEAGRSHVHQRGSFFGLNGLNPVRPTTRSPSSTVVPFPGINLIGSLAADHSLTQFCRVLICDAGVWHVFLYAIEGQATWEIFLVQLSPPQRLGLTTKRVKVRSKKI